MNTQQTRWLSWKAFQSTGNLLNRYIMPEKHIVRYVRGTNLSNDKWGRKTRRLTQTDT